MNKATGEDLKLKQMEMESKQLDLPQQKTGRREMDRLTHGVTTLTKL